MTQLNVTEIRTLEILLIMHKKYIDDEGNILYPGYVLNFTFRTLHNFLSDLDGLGKYESYFHDIRNDSRYDGPVSAIFLHNFITDCFPLYNDELVGKIILKFVEYIRHETRYRMLREEDFPEELMIDATNIANKLLGKPLIEYQPKTLYSDNKVNIIIETEVFNEKVKELLNDGHHSEAVRHAYQVVFGKLDELTGQKTPTQAFEKTTPKDILGYMPKEESKENLYEGIKSLHIAIQKFRNDIAHPLPKDIKENRDMDKNLALHYIALASLAYRLITSNRKGV